MSSYYSGLPACDGMAIANAVLMMPANSDITKFRTECSESEYLRLESAINKSKEEITKLYDHVLNEQGADKAAIFEAHLMLLSDPTIIKQCKENIDLKNYSAEFSYSEITQEFIEKFQALEDEYFQERALDIKDISRRVLDKLQGIETINLSSFANEVIIVADDITPSQAASMNAKYVKGFITQVGGHNSHTAIIARSLEIPAVVGCENILSSVKESDTIALNGNTGEININPSAATIKEYQDHQETILTEKKELSKYVGTPSVTKDGITFQTYANMASEIELDALKKYDAEGIGLLRTEFLYMESAALPSEDKQFNFYKQIAKNMGDKVVTIRTMDIGGDKNVDYLNLEKEENPFLGYRAIRICLDRLDIFKPQLRAILRASSFGNLRIMFPMISNLEELATAKKILSECKAELDSEQISYDKNIMIGIMIEIPSVAIMADVFAKEVDFFSIGTNDLIQYTVAVDRMSKKVSDLYTYFHPAILRLISHSIKSAKEAGIPIGMCGSMAQDPLFTEVLVGMGLNSFSVAPPNILKVRKNIQELNTKYAKEIAEHVLTLSSTKEIKNYLTQKGIV